MKKGEKAKTPYEVVPNVRPVILVGPSLKGYEGKQRHTVALQQIIQGRYLTEGNMYNIIYICIKGSDLIF